MSNPLRQPNWKLETTHPDIVDEVKTALREVVDPELGLEIIQLGLVRDVEIMEDKVLVTMILTTPFCPYAPAMMESTRKKTEDVITKIAGEKPELIATTLPVEVEMGFEVWDFSYMEEGVGGDWGLYY